MARAEVTPPVGIYHRMWGAATHDQSTGVHRPLWGSALVFQPTEGTTAGRAENAGSPASASVPDDEQVLVTLDHCLLWQAEMDSLLQRVCAGSGLSRDQVTVTFSHTHAAGLMGLERAELPGGEMIPPYLDRLGGMLAELVAQARHNVQPVTMTYGAGRCSMAAHRDLFVAGEGPGPDQTGHSAGGGPRGRWVCGFNPSGQADDTLLVVRITDRSDRPIGTIVNYGCHPTTLAWENTLISPDYPGALRETVEQTTGAPCVFMLGACAEVGPRDGFVGDVGVADRNGRQLAYAALSALESLPPPRTAFEYSGAVVSGATIGTWKHVPADEETLKRGARFRIRRFTVDLAYPADRPSLEELKAERNRCLEAEETACRQGSDESARDFRALAERMTRALARRFSLPDGETFPFPVTLMRLGESVWVTVEGEPYQQLQTELRSRFPGTPLVVAVLANGSRCSYLPPMDLYGTGIYEASVAVLAPGALERLIDRIGSEIERL